MKATYMRVEDDLAWSCPLHLISVGSPAWLRRKMLEIKLTVLTARSWSS